MKFTVELNIDWIGDDGSIDDEVSHQIKEKLVNNIQKEFSENAGLQIAKQAESLIKAKTDNLINTMLERPVVISNGWNKSAEYESIYDMVEQKMTALYDTKVVKTSTSCEKDPYLSKVESFVKSQVDQALRIISLKIETQAKASAKKAIEENMAVKAMRELMEKNKE